MIRKNPCILCGACCAYFRVSFYWGEAELEMGGSVPKALTEDVTPFYRCMAGTNQKEPRCVALEGVIGQQTFCSIYADRSTSCREFGVQWDDGVLHLSHEDIKRCNKARKAWGLPPLNIRVTNFDYSRPVMHHEPHMKTKPRIARKKRHGRTNIGDKSAV
jgi:Fe-S-cluster containining protein